MQSRVELSLFIPVLLFFCSSVVAYFAYGVVRAVEGPQHAIARGLKAGTNSYFLMFNSSCVGKLDTDITTSSGIVLKTHAEVRFSLNRVQKMAKIFVGAYFNPLGQFIAGSIKWDLADSNLLIVARNPNPIDLEVSFRGGGQNFERKLSIAGPIELKQSGDGSYYVGSEVYNSQLSGYLAPVGNMLDSKYKLTVVEANSVEGRQCGSEEQKSAVILDNVIADVQTSIAPLRNLIPGLNN